MKGDVVVVDGGLEVRPDVVPGNGDAAAVSMGGGEGSTIAAEWKPAVPTSVRW